MNCEDCKFFYTDMVTGDGKYLGHWGYCKFHMKNIERDDECYHLVPIKQEPEPAPWEE